MPPRSPQTAQVGKRKVEVSNLDKVLYPDDRIIKAQLIQYYFEMAPTILAHLKGRPLSLVRYPDGITGESFYQKNRPEWAPSWVEHAQLGSSPKDYVLATEAATLVWLANLAGIELHQMHSRAPAFQQPDYIVFDFDPPPGYPFVRLVPFAFEFKQHLESLGYHPFVKTTGRKGLHIMVPIEPRWTFDQTFAAAKEVATPFVEHHQTQLTLQLSKAQRKGRVLLDIYRNRESQTIIAAYSVRGTAGAPVSTPLPWDELRNLKQPAHFNITTVPQRVLKEGDPWETFSAMATPIHTAVNTRPPAQRPHAATQSKPNRTKTSATGKRTYKTPQQLTEYARKRSADKTPEPYPTIGRSDEGNSFVVHRHHASRLHYDLRLEEGGVLKSWAVPKGLPPRPGIKRLAVNVEDHPLAYREFEGAIPRGEYGAGMMWIYAAGRYQLLKRKSDGLYFRLHSPELNGEYRLIHTRTDQWLLERIDTPQIDWVRDEVQPMLAQPAEHPPNSPDYVYELKWDGIRALVAVDEGEIRLQGRHGSDLTSQFPELCQAHSAFRATSARFDGEIVCLDAEGKPDFQKVLHRLQQKNPNAVERASKQTPAVCQLFDCLYLDGRPVMSEPWERRREWLDDALKPQPHFRLSASVEEGQPLLDAVRSMQLEGIVAKNKRSTYLPGKRNPAWLKIKARLTMECLIVGYTVGTGELQNSFGALHLASPNTSPLQYLGRVGTGFDSRTRKHIWNALQRLHTETRPLPVPSRDATGSAWCIPKLKCKVQFASKTHGGKLRHPAFLHLCPES